MEVEKKIIRFDCFDTKEISTGVSAKELIEDGARLLCVTASACAGRCEMLNNEALIEGTVEFTAIYKKDDEIKKIKRSERFGMNETISGATPKSYMYSVACAEKVRGYIEAGSLMLACNVRIKGTLITPVEKEAIVSITGEDIRTRESSITVGNVTVNMPLRFAEKSETVLSPRLPEIKEILSSSASVTVRETHISAGQLIIGGEILYQTVYSSLDEYEPVVQMSDHSEFSQIIELKNNTDAKDICVCLCSENILLSPFADENGEMRKIDITVDICGYAYAVENSDVTIITDAYSVKNKLNAKKEKLEYCMHGEKKIFQNERRINVGLPENKIPMARMNALVFVPSIIESKTDNGKIMLCGQGETAVIYMASGNGETDGFNATQQYDFSVENTYSDALVSSSLTDIQASLVSGNEAEIKAGFRTEIIPSEKISVEFLQNIDIVNDCDVPEFGIIAYNVQKGESLWDICKYFGVDEEDVRSVNPDMNGEPEEGKQIYIFRRLVV